MLLQFQPNPQSPEAVTWSIPSRNVFFSYLWNFLSLDSRPYLFRIITTEKYKSETAAARTLITIIWRKLVFRIRGHPTGEMLKCQEAGKRQEMPILKLIKKKQKKQILKQSAPKRSHLTETYLKVNIWVKPPVFPLGGICTPAPSLLLFCYFTHYYKTTWMKITPWW